MKRLVMSSLAACHIAIFLSFAASASIIAGDVDLSGEVNATDIQLAINSALGITATNLFADLDYNGETTAVDVQLVINAALGLIIDSDQDGLCDAAESNAATDPHDTDSDDDGLSDGEELFEYLTNPLQPDTDGDGKTDGQEVADGDDPLTPPGTVIINEYVASNDAGLEDQDGDRSDWLELHNRTSTSVSLAGWTLTDDPNEPDKWTFPEVTIVTGEYMVVFASGKDITASPVIVVDKVSNLHTNFKLDRGGEYLALFDADGVPQESSVFDPEYPEQVTDLSYGRLDTEPGFWYFDPATPGSANQGSAVYRSIVDEPSFSVEHGFRDAPFDLTITCAFTDAIIRYTLDGSAPTQTRGEVYTDPIPVAENTVIRAAAFKEGFLPSAVRTCSYLFDVEESVRSMPAIYIVGDEPEALYEPNGIMAIVGGHYEQQNVGADAWVPDGPDDYNNPMQSGLDYERPVSVEYIRPEDNDGFTIDCGIRVHGSDYHRERYRRDGDWTLCSDHNYAKFSFRLYFRDDYGSDELAYPLFGESSVDTFKRVVLRGGHNDSCNPFVKDELVRRLHDDMGHVASRGTFVNLFINGEYKGYYNPCERIDQDFFQTWYDSDLDWDVLIGLNVEKGYNVREGDNEALEALLEYVLNNDLSRNIHYQEVDRRLDIVSFIDYLILHLYCGSADWPNNNWVAARERSDGTELGKFRIYTWDSEVSFAPEYGSTPQSNGFNQFAFWRPGGGAGLNGEPVPLALLYQALKHNINFRLLFADRVRLHFWNDGALTQTNVTRRFEELQTTLSGVIPDMDTYILDTWVPQRLDVLLGQFAEEGLY